MVYLAALMLRLASQCASALSGHPPVLSHHLQAQGQWPRLLFFPGTVHNPQPAALVELCHRRHACPELRGNACLRSTHRILLEVWLLL